MVACAVLVAAGILWFGAGDMRRTNAPDRTAVSDTASSTIENGVQVVDITARGGYNPRITRAEAGRETQIRVHTENTYDCSSAVVIPALDFEVTLGPSETRTATVPAGKAQGTLEGLCSMGMYRFKVVFE